MTDEVEADAGSGGPKFAGWIDIEGNFHPLTRLEFGTGQTGVQVDDVDGQRMPVKIGGAVPLPTGAATEATLASFLAANHTDLAALATLLVATNTDLGTVLHGDLASILAKQSSDPATQTTLAAVLAKLTNDPATQTTLAALLATAGATTGAAVITDANGTIQQYLRGFVKQWIAGTLLICNGATFTSRSAASTVAATSTQLMAANAARQSMKVQAPLGADLWINELGGTAGISLVDCTYIPAGVLYEPRTVSRSAITYYCSTGSLVINASEA